MMFVPFEMCTVALALMIVEMVPIGVRLKIGFLDDFLDDFVDDLPDGWVWWEIWRRSSLIFRCFGFLSEVAFGSSYRVGVIL